MTSAEGASHKVNGTGEGCIERLEPATAFEPKHPIRDRQSGEGCNNGKRDHVQEEEAKQAKNKSGPRAGDNCTAHAHGAICVDEEHL